MNWLIVIKKIFEMIFIRNNTISRKYVMSYLAFIAVLFLAFFNYPFDVIVAFFVFISATLGMTSYDKQKFK